MYSKKTANHSTINNNNLQGLTPNPEVGDENDKTPRLSTLITAQQLLRQ
jgi:hypothetical protein